MNTLSLPLIRCDYKWFCNSDFNPLKRNCLNYSVEGGIQKIDSLIKQGATKEQILEDLRNQQVAKNFSNEYKYYILLYGAFNNEDRNIIKRWTQYEDLFVTLVHQDGKKVGERHLMQSIVLFFIRRYPSYGVYAGTFCKLLYEQELFNEEFFVPWFNKKLKLDKKSATYDRKAEKQFKEHISQFVNWLQ